MRYRLRTLLIVLALGPPVLAVGWWGWSAWSERRATRYVRLCEHSLFPDLDGTISLREHGNLAGEASAQKASPDEN